MLGLTPKCTPIDSSREVGRLAPETQFVLDAATSAQVAHFSRSSTRRQPARGEVHDIGPRRAPIAGRKHGKTKRLRALAYGQRCRGRVQANPTIVLRRQASACR